MKATRAQLSRAMATPAATRLFLFHGPDESGSRALAGEVATAMGDDAERIDLTGAVVKADPARLADEAAAISLFGGARWIRVEPAGDEIIDAVDALLVAAAAGNPVVVVAGALRKDAKLLVRALADPHALVFASYPPEGQEADQLVSALGHDAGIRIRPDVAHRIVAATGGDRALIAQEIAKFALYVDAAPDRPQDVDHAALDALGADSDEGDLNRLIDAVLDGAIDVAVDEMARIGMLGITQLRSLMRRLLVLAQLRSVVEQGESVSRAIERGGRSLFWRDRQAIGGQLGRWTADRLAIAIGRVIAVEQAIMASGSAGPLAEAEFLAIAREAARRR